MTQELTRENDLSEKDLNWWLERFENGKAWRDGEPYAFERVAATVLRMALRSLTQPATAGEWRPIETAPRDGTVIRVSVPGYWAQGHDVKWTWVHNYPERDFNDEDELGEKDKAEYDRKGWMSNHCQGELVGPTHWMPLPPPPKTAGGE